MLKVLLSVLWSVWQWFLSLLPECMLEPVPAAEGAGCTVPDPRKGEADTTAGDTDDPPDAPPPPQDVPNSRGALAVPLHGTQPEPVKDNTVSPPPAEPEPKPPEVIINLKPKRKSRGKDDDRGRGGR